jgi:YVTN family beta-propeller protein
MRHLPATDERRRRVGARYSTTLAIMMLTPVIAFFLSSSPASATPQGFASGTVYVTNLNLNTVTAIDASNAHATVLHASTPQLNGPLGIAISPDGATAYVTNSDGNTVRPINLRSNPPSFEAPIKVGSGPAAIAITPNGNYGLRHQLQ